MLVVKSLLGFGKGFPYRILQMVMENPACNNGAGIVRIAEKLRKGNLV
jgi:hypothetical protein